MLTVDQAGFKITRCVFAHIQFQVGVALVYRVQDIRKQIGPQRRGDAESVGPHAASGKQRGLSGKSLRFLKHPSCAKQQFTPLRRGVDAFSGALKQLDIERFFHNAHLVAQGRLCDVEAKRCLAETAIFGDRGKILQLFE